MFKVLIMSYVVDFSDYLAHEELLGEEPYENIADTHQCPLETTNGSQNSEDVVYLPRVGIIHTVASNVNSHQVPIRILISIVVPSYVLDSMIVELIWASELEYLVMQ